MVGSKAKNPSGNSSLLRGSKVLLLLGSANDEKYLSGCVEILKQIKIPFVVRVASAHRSPQRVVQILETIRPEITICFAGHSAHLAGVAAAHLTSPVIAVPLPTSDLAGFDSLLSSVQMPAGVPVATMAIGDVGSRNAGCLAAQILSLSDNEVLERWQKYKRSLATKVESSSAEVEKKWQA